MFVYCVYVWYVFVRERVQVFTSYGMHIGVCMLWQVYRCACIMPYTYMGVRVMAYTCVCIMAYTWVHVLWHIHGCVCVMAIT